MKYAEEISIWHVARGGRQAYLLPSCNCTCSDSHPPYGIPFRLPCHTHFVSPPAPALSSESCSPSPYISFICSRSRALLYPLFNIAPAFFCALSYPVVLSYQLSQTPFHAYYRMCLLISALLCSLVLVATCHVHIHRIDKMIEHQILASTTLLMPPAFLLAVARDPTAVIDWL